MTEKFTDIRENISLKAYNTFGIDVNARYFSRFGSESDLIHQLKFATDTSLAKLILGGGSNVLFERDYEGLVLRNEIPGISLIQEDSKHVWVSAGSGVVWNDLVMWAVKHKFGGIENLSLIPGSVGAGPIQNIGAYGVELKDTFWQLEAIRIENGEKVIFSAEQCHFGYRDSIFKQQLKGKLIITKVVLRLDKDPTINTSYGVIEKELNFMGVKANNVSVKDVSDAVIRIRKSKLPDPSVLGNAGSFFKNPEVPNDRYSELKGRYPGLVGYPFTPDTTKIAAGWMIEYCGWKGKRVGAVGSHKDQALVLVNYGGAKGIDVINLAAAISKSVLDEFGVVISPEVNIIR